MGKKRSKIEDVNSKSVSDVILVLRENEKKTSHSIKNALTKKVKLPKPVIVYPDPDPDPCPIPDPYPFSDPYHEPLPEPPNPQEPEILSVAEKMPEFPGGNEKLLEFIKKNIRYPELCSELGIEGNVYVKLVIDTIGRVTQVSIARGIKEQCGLDQEALRVVKLLPNFIPAENNGKKVAVYYHVPVRFRLE
jgi:protein TonB